MLASGDPETCSITTPLTTPACAAAAKARTEREAQSDILAPYDAEFAEYVEINSWLLVFRRLLHPIDSNYVSKCLSHFQFQPELLLNRREKIGRFFGICGCGRQRSRVS